MSPEDERLACLLLETRTIALVGASLKPARPSHQIGAYMASQGYRVIPVNPGHAGKTLFGETIVARLADIDQPVDMLNVFRRPEAIPDLTDEAIKVLPGLRSVWLQLGLISVPARQSAVGAGLHYVENRCLMVEHRRLIAHR